MWNPKSAAFLISCCWILAAAATPRDSSYFKTIYVIKSMNTYVQFTGVKPKSINVGGSTGDFLWSVDPGGIVMFKAVRKNFPATNMLVTTKDTVLQFRIEYGVGGKGDRINKIDLSFNGRYSGVEKTAADRRHDSLNKLLKTKPYSEAEILVRDAANPSEYQGDFQPASFGAVRQARREVKRVNFGDGYGMLSLVNFLQDKDFFYFVLGFENRSKIEFPIDYLSFEVKSVKPAQKNETDQRFYAKYVPDPTNAKVIFSGDRKRLIYATRKFALRRDEELHIKLFERSVNSKGRQYEMVLRQKVFNRSLQVLQTY
ncbi:DUF4138 domain-containing protein [Paraflavisolibacter sp. H34]|uniref:DUF4138 domain-containing protein n=1 Tax=Huijunlia imazamoxiresistens TaxID=3127457 RepID=UPI0030195DA8